MPTDNATAKLNRVLQALFIAQARDAMNRLTVASVEADREPDMTRWIEVMANAVKPILLQQYQQGMAKTAARLGAKVNSLPDKYTDGIRRYSPGNDSIFGIKELRAGHASLVSAAAGASVNADRLHFYKSLRRVVVKSPKAQKVLVDFDLFSPKVLDAVDTAVYAFCRETMETATTDLHTAVADLRRLMREGLPRGDSVAYLARRVREIFADPMRAFRIAVTETSRAMHQGQLDVAKEAGLKKKYWIASSDACELCLSLEELGSIDIDKPFKIVGDNPYYSRIMAPPAHPYCFCSLGEELD